MAKLRHPGGCNAAPRALLNLREAAGEKLKIRAGARQTLLGMTDRALFDYHMVFMHGRNGFRLTETCGGADLRLVTRRDPQSDSARIGMNVVLYSLQQ